MCSIHLKAAIFGAILTLTNSAFACPDIYKIPDYNCDGDLQIVVIGDSLVYGTGDTKYKNKGGYVLRLQKKLKKAAIQNLGKPGLRTIPLLEALRDAFDRGKSPKLKKVLRSADIVIVDIGRNDYWLFGPAKDSYRNIVSIGDAIRKEVKKLTKIEPMVVTAVSALPNRTGQGVWVKELVALIAKNSTATKPSDLRFDLVSKRLLNPDQIHPSSKGYDAMGEVLLKYLQGNLAKKMRALRPDTDKDGLPDLLETDVYKTDPAVADTDGDGKSDGNEVLTANTNPRIAD